MVRIIVTLPAGEGPGTSSVRWGYYGGSHDHLGFLLPQGHRARPDPGSGQVGGRTYHWLRSQRLLRPTGPTLSCCKPIHPEQHLRVGPRADYDGEEPGQLRLTTKGLVWEGRQRPPLGPYGLRGTPGRACSFDPWCILRVGRPYDRKVGV